jgi:L,D-transpeptidase-like protein
MQRRFRRSPLAIVKLAAMILAAAVVIGGAGVVLWSNDVSSRSSATYEQRRQALDAQLALAVRQGYTSQDLAPVTARATELERGHAPWWILARPGFYGTEAATAASVTSQLSTLERLLYRQAQAAAGSQVGAAGAEIAKAQDAGAATSDVQALQQRLSTVTQAGTAARTLGDYRSVAGQALSVLSDATAVRMQAEQENQAIQQAAQQLIAQSGGSLGAVQQAGQQALANGRNDASAAAYLSRGKMLNGYDAIQRTYGRLESFASLVGSADVNQAARGAAAAQRYAGQIHAGLTSGMPARAVIVSFQAQHVWAYLNAQVAMDSAVTTGIRGVTNYGTDFGPMKVWSKDHPWTMRSPYPKTSPLWYKDTVVQWTVWFTPTKVESFHDASWEPDSLLGPGSEYNASTRSHGCIHLPANLARWLFDWAPVGTPVVVYPGDGSPVTNQLALMTTDDQGTPQTTP